MSKAEIAGEDLKFTPLPEPVPQVLTGGLVAELAGADEPENYVVCQWLADGRLETLGLNERAEHETGSDQRFILFRSSATYLFEIDGQRFDWGAPRILGSVLKQLACVDPTQFGVWQENAQGDDTLIENDQYADLKNEGLERFFTAKKESTEGNEVADTLLPRRCRRYLDDSKWAYRETFHGGTAAVIIDGFELPKEKFDHDNVSLLLLLPDGYPDASPDMFYVHPWIKLRDALDWPAAAATPHRFLDKEWQRWSRHWSDWRPGRDGIQTWLLKTKNALESA